MLLICKQVSLTKLYKSLHMIEGQRRGDISLHRNVIQCTFWCVNHLKSAGPGVQTSLEDHCHRWDVGHDVGGALTTEHMARSSFIPAMLSRKDLNRVDASSGLDVALDIELSEVEEDEMTFRECDRPGTNRERCRVRITKVLQREVACRWREGFLDAASWVTFLVRAWTIYQFKQSLTSKYALHFKEVLKKK